MQKAPPRQATQPLVISVSDNEAMARLAKPGFSEFDALTLISKWSLDFAAGKQSALRSISGIANRAIEEISRLASDGSDEATKALHGLAYFCVNDLDELCNQVHHQPALENIAHKTSIWPGFLSCDRDIKKRNEKLVRKLALGRLTGLNYSGKQWSRETPEVSVALKLWGIINVYREEWQTRDERAKHHKKVWEQFNKRIGRPANYRPPPRPLVISEKHAAEFKRRDESRHMARNLRPLDRNNYKEWFQAALPEFINFYGEDFENRKLFHSYWQHAAYKSEPNARALIRRAIKTKLQQAFCSIAPKPPRM
jgi:hypothetical protein